MPNNDELSFLTMFLVEGADARQNYDAVMLRSRETRRMFTKIRTVSHFANRYISFTMKTKVSDSLEAVRIEIDREYKKDGHAILNILTKRIKSLSAWSKQNIARIKQKVAS